jgi:hypothetical protein
VKHLRNNDGGQASSFNAGFARAQSEFVAILDRDNCWVERKRHSEGDKVRDSVAAISGHGSADHAKTSARIDYPHFREMAFMTHSTTQAVANGRGTWCWKSRFSTGGVTLRTEFTSPSTRYRLVGRGR